MFPCAACVRLQFLRVLQKERLLTSDAKVVAAVVKKFANGSNDRTARVDYRSFVARVDPRSGALRVFIPRAFACVLFCMCCEGGVTSVLPCVIVCESLSWHV